MDICQAVKAAVPGMHVHAFSPLEVWQGAETLGISLRSFLTRLKDAGLGTLPGTAAEILDDEVRQVLCPDKLDSEQWLEVMRTAHGVGFRTTATIMYGHVDRPIQLGATSEANPRPPGGDRRVHGDRGAPVRPHGGPDLPEGTSPKGADLQGSDPHARGRPTGAASGRAEHPGLLGQDGTARCRGLPQRRRQRPGGHADEREHHAGGRASFGRSSLPTRWSPSSRSSDARHASARRRMAPHPPTRWSGRSTHRPWLRRANTARHPPA